MRPVRAVVLTAISVFLAIPIPGSAAPAGVVDFVVTSISPFAGTGKPLQLEIVVRNIGDTPSEEVALRFTLHDRVRTRSDLRRALDGRPRSDLLTVTTEQLETPLQAGERRVVKIERDLATLASPFRRPQDGVYPLTIQLRIGGETIMESATAVPFFFEQPASRLNVVAVVPIHVPAAFDARGDYEIGGLDRSVLQGGRLDRMLSALGAHISHALTIIPTALTLDQLDDLADGFVSRDSSGRHEVRPEDAVAGAAKNALERLRSIAASPSIQTVAGTYARADVVGLAHNAMIQDLRTQFTLERERDSLLLGHSPAEGIVAPGDFALDSRSAVEVSRLGGKTLILAPESLPERRSRFGYDRPETVTGGGGVRFTALVVDAEIRDRLIRNNEPVLNAQAALAETAASYFELPALAGERVLVVATPSSPDPLGVLSLIQGLASAPWIQLRTAGDAAGALTPSEEPVALPLRRTGDRPPLSSARAARRIVDTLGAVLEDPGTVQRLRRFILAAESADWIREPSRGSILAQAARGAAERQLGLIRVASRQITLTSRDAREIPVTVINDTGQAVRVQVVLSSTKIEFPDGATRVIDVPERIATLTFRAKTRVTGSFPVTVRLLSADGTATVSEGQLIVRSTAVSAVTLIATGGGVLVLVAGWVRRAVRDRRRESAPAA